MLGASSPEMALAVSAAGGIGSLAAAGMHAAALQETISHLRTNLGEKPFIVNLFVLAPPEVSPETLRAAMAALAPYRAELGLGPQAIPNSFCEDFSSQFDALCAAAPPAASFTFGILSHAQIARLHAHNIAVYGTATTLAEARAWVEAGADAVIAQGFEAGGHRGTFLNDVEHSQVGTLALVAECIRALPVPVIAAGGIMDGRDLAAMLALGAHAVQMGTAFLLTPESRISAPWRAALIGKTGADTALTRAFSGRHARGLHNRFMADFAQKTIPPYPIQNALTTDLRAQAAKANRPDLLSLWAGQGVGRIEAMASADLVEKIWLEARKTLHATARQFTL